MKKLLAIVLGFLLFGGSGYWYWSSQSAQKQSILATSLVPYDQKKHKSFIKKEFKSNWYLLINSPEYDLDHMLDTLSPNNYASQYHGKMKIIVLEVENRIVAFGSYYMRNNFQGKILFVEVAKEFRGKRYAEKLVNHAVQELKKMGAKIVRLETRTDNKSARRLYNRLGFIEVNEERGFVFYRKEV